MGTEVKAEDKSGFTVQNEPEVVFAAPDLYHGLIGMPLIRVEIQHGNELKSDVLEQGDKAGTPVADGRVGDPDIHHGTENQSDIAEGILTQVEHGQGHEDHMDRIAHPFEICFPKELGHRWSGDCRGLRHKQGMITLFVSASIIAVIFHVMVQESRLAAHRAGGVSFCSRTARPSRRRFGSEWMPTLLTLIFLVSVFLFSVAIKVRFVVALWATHLI